MITSLKKKSHMIRCDWASNDDPINLHYHDKEWGVPIHNDRLLFEFLILEGAQAGLSWITILRRRQHYREVFNHFDVNKIAQYDRKKVTSLLADARIIRNRLKIESAISNAKAYLKIQDEHKSFSNYLWNFVDGKPIQNKWQRQNQVPSNTALSDQLSKDLKKKGFRFVGTTICYAFMQAVGIVNDHLTTCFRHKEIKQLGT